jgi:AbrB family looped-hinge helix DNA binding protein
MMKRKEEFDTKFYGSATVGTKGQIVIPSRLRKDFDIKQGDTLIFIGGHGGEGFGVVKPEALLGLQKKLEGLQRQIEKIKK